MRKRSSRATDTAARKSTVSTNTIVAAAVAIAAVAFDAYLVYSHARLNRAIPDNTALWLFVIMAAIAAYATYEAFRFQREHRETRKAR